MKTMDDAHLETAKPREGKAAFADRVRSKMPQLFVAWLFLTVLAPHQDLYKVFFHGIVIPALLILLVRRRTGINWRDPFLRVSLAFFAYASISTFLVGMGPLEDHFRAFRWGVEVTFCLLALYTWMPEVVAAPRWWGRLFLWLAFLGATAAILLFLFVEGMQGRLWGLGALHNPIQAGSILLVYLAIGHFLLLRTLSAFSSGERWLFIATAISVGVAVLLSESRAPIGAMVVYFCYIGGLRLFHRPNIRELLIAIVVVVGVLGLIVWLYGGEQGFLQELIGRGASYRIDIWKGYLEYPPESWWFGFGAGTPFDVLPAAEAFWIPNGVPTTHAHNLFLGTLVETGIIGLGFLFTMLALLLTRIFRQGADVDDKMRLLGILGLVFMLTLTGSHTVISSIKAVWLFLWVPIIFAWFWADRNGYQPAE